MTPIARGVVVLSALAAGFAGGALAPRAEGRPAQMPAEPATEVAGRRESGDPLPGAAEPSKRSVLPEAGSKPVRAQGPSAEELRAQAAALRAMIASAAAAEDGRALLALVRRLARLGEPGFEGAAEALTLLVAAINQEPPGLGIHGDDVWRLLSNPDLAAFEEWVLSDPSRGPSEMRAQVATEWCWLPDIDPMPFALERLKAETDAEVLQRLTMALYFATPRDYPAMVEAARAQSTHLDVASNIIRYLARRGGDEAWPFLQELVDSPVPEIAGSALAWSRVIRPPVKGLVVTFLPKDADSQFLLGDILVSWDGAALTGGRQVYELIDKWTEGSSVSVLVHRGDGLVPVVLAKKPSWIGTRPTAEKK